MIMILLYELFGFVKKSCTFAAKFPKYVTKMGKNNNEEIENSIFFENSYSFSCVCALFVVPLSPIK